MRRIRQVLALGLVLSLAAQPLMAGDLRKAAERAGAAEAQRQDQAKRDQIWGMSPGYFWTGAALVGVGASTALYVLALKNDACSQWNEAYLGDCPDAGFDTTAIYYLAMAGAGVGVWAVGKNKGKALNSATTFQPHRGGVSVLQRIRF